jgi:predicted HTH domain antitoxin
MKTFQIELPEELEWSEADLRLFVAVKLYEAGKLTAGRAAETVGMTKRAFLESLGRFGVSMFQYSGEELLDDLERVKPRVG